MMRPSVWCQQYHGDCPKRLSLANTVEIILNCAPQDRHGINEGRRWIWIRRHKLLTLPVAEGRKQVRSRGIPIVWKLDPIDCVRSPTLSWVSVPVATVHLHECPIGLGCVLEWWWHPCGPVLEQSDGETSQSELFGSAFLFVDTTVALSHIKQSTFPCSLCRNPQTALMTASISRTLMWLPNYVTNLQWSRIDWTLVFIFIMGATVNSHIWKCIPMNWKSWVGFNGDFLILFIHPRWCNTHTASCTWELAIWGESARVRISQLSR